MNVRLQNVKVFVSIIYIAPFGVVSVLTKKVSFLNDIPEIEFLSEVRNV
jgi:hypothetical protein